jgi:hypothetical protein
MTKEYPEETSILELTENWEKEKMTDKINVDELIERIEDIIEGAKDFDGLITPIGETLVDCKVELQQLKGYLKPQKDWQDRDDELTDEIENLHPCETGDHKTYTKAMELIGNRHSKGSLVCLVNYFLAREKKLKAMQESKWQPIETAPKDTWIIVGREDDEIAIASDYIYIGVSGIPKYIGWVSNSYDERGERESLWFEPTHWQPLLEPPTGDKSGK